MKTAMQELEEKLKDNLKWIILNADYTLMEKLFSEALEKEKEQITDAWEKGYSTGCVVGGNDYTNEDEEKDNGNYYFNQTYNQNK